MKTLKRILAAALVTMALAWSGAAPADDPKPLSESDVLKLVELKIPDEVITRRVLEGGVDFPAGESVLSRLKQAGASESVLAASTAP